LRDRASSLKRLSLLAAFVLLLFQSFGFGLAEGAAALPASVDAFGNPLCAHADQRDDTGHPIIPDCCTVACVVHLPALAATPQQAIAIRRDSGAFALSVASRDIFPVAPEHDPGRPRAPPTA
jgi:hypothetical protein